MLDQLGKHSLANLTVKVKGDLYIDEHHTSEDTGLALGEAYLKALSDKKGAGIGLTLGVCVAFIGLVFDHLIRTWVEQRKKHLGID